MQNAVGVTGLLHGNQGKAQTIQVAGFHRRDSQAPIFLFPSTPLSLFLFRRPFPSRSSASFFFSSFFLPIDSLPHADILSPRRIFLLYRFCFFSSLPHCIQSESTKLETVALSALLRLLLFAGFTLFVYVCMYMYCVSLPFFPPLYSCPFYCCSGKGRYSCTETRRLALTSRGQATLTVDTGSRFIERAVPEAVVLSHRLQLNLKSRKIFLKLSVSGRNILSL